MRHDTTRLEDVLEAIAAIRSYITLEAEMYKDNPLIATAVQHQLMIIGEALAALSAEVRAENDWVKPIIRMRNILVHRYFAVEAEIVWNVVDNDLDQLESKIKSLLATLSE
jgi:uncharacterized protein with HEPN domain